MYRLCVSHYFEKTRAYDYWGQCSGPIERRCTVYAWITSVIPRNSGGYPLNARNWPLEGWKAGRDGTCLNGCGCFVTSGLYSLQNFWRQRQVSKLRHIGPFYTRTNSRPVGCAEGVRMTTDLSTSLLQLRLHLEQCACGVNVAQENVSDFSGFRPMCRIWKQFVASTENPSLRPASPLWPRASVRDDRVRFCRCPIEGASDRQRLRRCRARCDPCLH